MNVARLNMSHGDHGSHRRVIDLVREHNKQATASGSGTVVALMLDTKVGGGRGGRRPGKKDTRIAHMQAVPRTHAHTHTHAHARVHAQQLYVHIVQAFVEQRCISLLAPTVP